MQYVLVDKSDQIVKGPADFDKKPDDLPQKGWRWLPVEDKPPTIDPATQRYSHTGWTIGQSKAAKVYAVADVEPAAPTLEERLTALEARVSALDGK